MKKFFVSLMAVFIMSSTLLMPAMSTVQAEDVIADRMLIGSQGIVTGVQSGPKTCGFLTDFSREMKTKMDKSSEEMQVYQREDAEMFDASAAINNALIDFGFSFISAIGVAASAVGSECAHLSDEGEGDTGFLTTVFNQTQVFSQLSNITNVGPLMQFVGITQWIAILLMMFFILYKGFQAFTGKTIDPVGLILRFMATMFLIYLSPYLLQDILNINNILVHYVSKMTVTLEEFTLSISEVLPASIIIMISQIQDMMAQSVTDLANAQEDSGESSAIAGGLGSVLLLVLTSLIIMIMIIVPFFKIIVWWYIRYFKIFLMAVIAPFMFLTFADEETEGTGYNFLKNFSVTVFEQFFMIIGVALTGAFIATVVPLMDSLGLGMIGSGIAIYAAISFLGTMPDIIGEWFRGGSGVRTSAGQMVGQMQSSAKRGSSNVRGTAKRTAGGVSKARDGMKSVQQTRNWNKDVKKGGAVADANRDLNRKNMNKNRYGEKRAKALNGGDKES